MNGTTILVDLDGYGNPRPVDAYSLDSETLRNLRYEADRDAVLIINAVLEERNRV